MRSIASIRVPPFVALAALAACSSSSSTATSGSGQNVGTVEGHSLSVQDGVAVNEPSTVLLPLSVVLGSRANLCPLLRGGTPMTEGTHEIANLTFLELDLQATGPGTYDLSIDDGGAPTAMAFFGAVDDSCNTLLAGLDDWATGGTVTLTRVDTVVEGSYDLAFGSDHLTGHFSVPHCDGVSLGGTPGASAPVCQK
jgi:hypothetical protein